MTTTAAPAWESKRTGETRKIEDSLRRRFARADAYRQNSATIRVRVIDPQFEGLSPEDRDAMVEPHLKAFDERTQADITTLFTFAPSEVLESQGSLRQRLLNLEFEDPSESRL